MDFLGRLIRFIFWVLVVTWGIKLVGRLLRSFGAAHSGEARNDAGAVAGAGGRSAEQTGKRLVRDPVCGMHIAEGLALPLNANGETQYFCSQECRAKYESSVLRRAANG
jgi:YHS domain-containing protein